MSDALVSRSGFDKDSGISLGISLTVQLKNSLSKTFGLRISLFCILSSLLLQRLEKVLRHGNSQRGTLTLIDSRVVKGSFPHELPA